LPSEKNGCIYRREGISKEKDYVPSRDAELTKEAIRKLEIQIGYAATKEQALQDIQNKEEFDFDNAE
jgi:hypothetical protein